MKIEILNIRLKSVILDNITNKIGKKYIKFVKIYIVFKRGEYLWLVLRNEIFFIVKKVEKANDRPSLILLTLDVSQIQLKMFYKNSPF